MDWRDRRVLVTGAGGFIGSHLAEELVRRGASTRALVHYDSRGSEGWLDRSELRSEMEVVPGDICDRRVLTRTVVGVDVVFHLAALIGIPYSYRAAESYVRTNVAGTLNVLEAARDAGIERLVHTSTSEVYGTARQVPIDESHPLQAQSPYAASKISADALVDSFHRTFGTPAVIVRPFNTFGPRQSARAVIPTIITQCLAGDRVRLGNTHPTRDMNYVANTVDAFLLAGSVPAVEGRTMNVGSGEEISIGDLAELIAELTGTSAEVEVESERKRPEKSEVDRLLADPSLAAELLGWRPDVDLREGLTRTIDWFRERSDLYRPRIYAV